VHRSDEAPPSTSTATQAIAHWAVRAELEEGFRERYGYLEAWQ